MKNVKRYFLSFLAALSIVLLAFGAVKAFAQDNAPGENDTYDVVLTKVKLSDLTGWPKQTGVNNEDYTGQKLNVTDYFGSGAKTLANVWFDVYKDTPTGTPVAGAATGADGTVTFTGLKAGKYYIVENKAKSTLTSDEQLANSAAVPVEINLPVFKATGGWYTTGTDAVHVYPKNTVDKPSIDKVVSEDAKHDTALVGETKTFKVTSTMPEGIKDYKVLKFTDKFSAGLTYTGNLVVKNGGTVVNPSNYSTTGTDPVGTKGAAISIAFNEDYIKTLNPKDVITITYDAVINEEAVMGAANPNDVKLTYGTNPDSTKEVKPNETPELHTGGAKFEKIDKATSAKLAGAKFVVTNEAGDKYLKQTAASGTTPAKNEWVANKADATVFTSAADGTFEVKGLPYGVKGNDNATGETKYKLVEVEAPTGYALLQQPVEFTISSTTYTGGINQVNNNKVTIPQTGGIGSALVIAAGVLVVGLGFIAKRRSAK
ncbi:LPXTG-motif cell wall anchor domain protein [Streptococcus sp. oral taxon 071 str. 73H25AP]|uniref:SpaH/EbpB family LPXTG-anchored major pilin n=1 Tax=Streptococcus sp. oral taxon 071 TaxID=712630 RepID=UPI0001E10675|nr:SpaH/EbpB family LPXTG-anchored major pilin [Streptococcus sp. oral taxon 071]EFM34826.1 LPXTG-motif cell wall anchor domain protein [Streptococcus sp. oral taxon 071 str. 73H25AP]